MGVEGECSRSYCGYSFRVKGSTICFIFPGGKDWGGGGEQKILKKKFCSSLKQGKISCSISSVTCTTFRLEKICLREKQFKLYQVFHLSPAPPPPPPPNSQNGTPQTVCSLLCSSTAPVHKLLEHSLV